MDSNGWNLDKLKKSGNVTKNQNDKFIPELMPNCLELMADNICYL